MVAKIGFYLNDYLDILTCQSITVDSSSKHVLVDANKLVLTPCYADSGGGRLAQVLEIQYILDFTNESDRTEKAKK